MGGARSHYWIFVPHMEKKIRVGMVLPWLCVDLALLGSQRSIGDLILRSLISGKVGSHV